MDSQKFITRRDEARLLDRSLLFRLLLLISAVPLLLCTGYLIYDRFCMLASAEVKFGSETIRFDIQQIRGRIWAKVSSGGEGTMSHSFSTSAGELSTTPAEIRIDDSEETVRLIVGKEEMVYDLQSRSFSKSKGSSSVPIETNK